MNFTLQFLLLILSLKSIYNENCNMKTHNFYLLPIEKKSSNNTIEFQGLKKYNYILILKTEPNDVDKYHIVLDVSFPINVNIELSNEIIYCFNSLEKFCINDLEKEGKYINILGKLYEYSTENNILERIWIKIDKILLYKNLESNTNRIYYLLSNYSEFDDNNKKYILMKKMDIETSASQNFQIVSVNILKDQVQSNNDYLCAIKNNYMNDLSIGDELTIFMTLNDDKLRDNFEYFVYVKNTKYKLSNVNIFLCKIYDKDKYNGNC